MNHELFTTVCWIAGVSLHLLAFIGVTLHALKRRRNPSATLLWIFLAWSFPIGGALLYLAFGIDRVPDKGLRKQIANQRVMQHRKRMQAASEGGIHRWDDDKRARLSAAEDEMVRKFNHAIDQLNPDHPLLEGNRMTPLISGDEAYPLMMEAIRSATGTIHMQSFIIANDEVGRDLLETLKQKAEEGVKVRLLFDRFGSTYAHLAGLFRKYRKIQNLEIHGWTQANPLKRQFQINLRNHRKNLVVDGKVAFFGGVNISAENITTDGRPAIRDYHFKVEGPLVHELQFSFLRDWFFMTEEPLEQLLRPEYFPLLEPCGPTNARIIDTGPSNRPGMLGETFFNAIVMAQEEILIVTPYFVPTIDIIKALRSAARRGINVQIVLPEKNNHPYTGLASQSLYEELLEAGVRVHHRAPPFIHAKAMAVDNTLALVGSANIDVRSLELNYETTVVAVGKELVARIVRNIKEDIKKSTEIDREEWLQRPPIHKLGENVCALMTPVL